MIFKNPIPFKYFTKNIDREQVPDSVIGEQYEYYIEDYEYQRNQFEEDFHNFIDSIGDSELIEVELSKFRTPESIGSRLKEARKRIDLTQIEAADKLDISKQSIYNYEKGLSTPSPSLLEKMAKLYFVSSYELLTGTPEFNFVSNNDNQKVISEIENKIKLIKIPNYDDYAENIEKATGKKPSEREWLIATITQNLDDFTIEQLYEFRKNTLLNSILNIEKK